MTTTITPATDAITAPWHIYRRWAVTDRIDANGLACDLTQRTWTLCTGFRIGGFLFLNDSLSENGAQEYAVVREADGVQVESITVSWMTRDQVRQIIDAALAGELQPVGGLIGANRILPGYKHRCPLCQ